MILRTPPPPKRPRADGDADTEVNRQLVVYEDPPESSQDPSVSEHMLCTYQCRQMVCFFPFQFHSLSASNQIITVLQCINNRKYSINICSYAMQLCLIIKDS